jgi:hypothetical protein
LADQVQTHVTTANRGLVLRVVGAIATSIGVIGFATVVGGAILWIRSDRADLPADKAVSPLGSGCFRAMTSVVELQLRLESCPGESGPLE